MVEFALTIADPCFDGMTLRGDGCQGRNLRIPDHNDDMLKDRVLDNATFSFASAYSLLLKSHMPQPPD